MTSHRSVQTFLHSTVSFAATVQQRYLLLYLVTSAFPWGLIFDGVASSGREGWQDRMKLAAGVRARCAQLMLPRIPCCHICL